MLLALESKIRKEYTTNFEKNDGGSFKRIFLIEHKHWNSLHTWLILYTLYKELSCSMISKLCMKKFKMYELEMKPA